MQPGKRQKIYPSFNVIFQQKNIALQENNLQGIISKLVLAHFYLPTVLVPGIHIKDIANIYVRIFTIIGIFFRRLIPINE